MDAQDPTTPQAKQTYENLLESAGKIFEEQGFFKASVVEICDKAGVSNGTFYRYFSDKNQIFVELADRLGTKITEKIERGFIHSDLGFDGRLRLLLQDYFSLLSENSSLYQIFRQAEFVNWNAHQVFYNKLTDTLSKGLNQGQQQGYVRDEDTRLMAHYLLGTLSFVSMRWIIWEDDAIASDIIDHLLDFLKNGIEKKETSERLTSPYFPGLKPESRRESISLIKKKNTSKTESRLLSAAESRFGKNGFYGTTVGDITREAGVAQGTFYHYFSSKLEVFETLVHEINELWRRKVRQRTRDLNDRREIEYEGFCIFFTFIAKHSNMYRIVREAEFVDKSLGRWYYESFANSYSQALASSMSDNQIRNLHPSVLAYSLMGIGHFLGQKWFVQENRERTPRPEFSAMFGLVLRGIKH